MAGAKSRSKHSQELCKAYRVENRCAKNKARKLKRHLKKYPNDAVAAAALKAGPGVTRKTPNNPKWLHMDKYFAQLMRSFGYKGDVLMKLKPVFSKAFDAEHNKLDAGKIEAVWKESRL